MYPFLLALVVPVALATAPRAGEAQTAVRPGAWLPAALGVALVATYAALRLTVLSFGDGGGATAPAPFGTRLARTGMAFTEYLRMLVWPVGLHMEQTLAGTPAWTAAVGYAALLALIALAVWAVRRQRPRVTFGIAWFLINWLPISGLFPLNAPLAEHWMYIPMAGFWLAVADLAWWAAQRQPAAGRALAPLAAAFIIGLLGAAVARNADWDSNETLFRDTIAKNPATSRVHYNLAVDYDDLRDNAAGAVRHYRQALALRADTLSPQEEGDLRLSLARNLAALGRYSEAVPQAAAVAQLQGGEAVKPYRVQGALLQADLLLKLGDFMQAQRAYQAVLQSEPGLRGRVQAALEGIPIDLATGY